MEIRYGRFILASRKGFALDVFGRFAASSCTVHKSVWPEWRASFSVLSKGGGASIPNCAIHGGYRPAPPVSRDRQHLAPADAGCCLKSRTSTPWLIEAAASKCRNGALCKRCHTPFYRQVKLAPPALRSLPRQRHPIGIAQSLELCNCHRVQWNARCAPPGGLFPFAVARCQNAASLPRL